jgi:hypothetical protein
MFRQKNLEEGDDAKAWWLWLSNIAPPPPPPRDPEPETPPRVTRR